MNPFVFIILGRYLIYDMDSNIENDYYTIAFYNLENLFDTIDNPNIDEEWLPNGAQNWTYKKYKQKLENLARVLSEIGTGSIQDQKNPNSPTLIGGGEIENRGVLEDLVKQALKNA